MEPSVAGSLLQAKADLSTNALARTEQKGSAKKSESAAREFESVLLSQWLQQAEQSFATVPGADQEAGKDPGRDQFLSLGVQAIAGVIAKSRGGLGIAAMIVRSLEPKEGDPGGGQVVSGSDRGFQTGIHPLVPAGKNE